MRTTTSFDELVDVPTEVLVGLLREHGERAQTASRGAPTWRRDMELWRAVLDALAAAADGDRPTELVAATPRWLDRVVTDVLRSAATSRWRGGDFPTIRILERRGLVSPPHDETYVLALVGALGGDPPTSALRADPELLASTIWRIFEVEGGGEVSLAAMDKHTPDDVTWSTTVRTLADAGDLDRDRLLDSTLAALDRDYSAFRAGWFSRLWTSLHPTEDEVAARQGALRPLLRSDVRTTVALAVGQLRVLAAAGRIESVEAAHALRPAVLAPVKGTALATIALLRMLADAARDDVVRAAADALGHPHAGVQQAAATLLTDLGAASVIAEAREHLAPSVAEAFGVATPAAVEPLPADIELSAPLTRTTGAALTESLAALLEGADDPSDLEMVLAGLTAAPDPGLLDPLRARAVKVLTLQPREGTTPAWLRGEIARFVLRGLGAEVDRRPVSHGEYAPTNTSLPVHFLLGRLDEVCAVVRGQAPARALLAAPEHAAGWVHAATLVERLRTTPAPLRLDLVAALLRLHPEGRADALAGASGVVRYALGGDADGADDAADDAWWVAAGRTRSTTEVDPLLLRRGLVGAGVAHPLALQVETAHDWRETGVWPWQLHVADGVSRLEVARPTGVRAAEGWSALDSIDVEAYVAWSATIWPADAEHFLVATAGAVLNAGLVGSEVEHDAVRVLAALGGHPGRLGALATTTLAAGLAAGRPDQRVHAVDAVDRLVRAGRLTPDMLAQGVVAYADATVLTRAAASWKDLATVSPQTSAFVVDTLVAALPGLGTAGVGMHAVLAVLDEELLRVGRPTPAAIQPWLCGFTGSSKAARLAARLAAR